MLIAITGANGFVGRHLSRHLRKTPYKLRLFQREKGKDVFQIKDFVNYSNWNLALSNVDILIHCAAKVHDLKNSERQNLNLYEEINVNLTETLAKEAVKSKVKRIIFISSIKVNGESTPEGYPFNNSSIPSPKDHYAYSKLKAENILNSISKKGNIEIVIIRPSLIYGPNVGANFLNLIKLVDLGIPIPFLGIKNKRSLLYVENLVSFIAECIENKAAANKTFLISDAKPISISNLIYLIKEALKKNIIIFRFPIGLIKILFSIINKRDTLNKLIGNLELDSSESYRILNWEPPFTTKEGLLKTVNWYSYKKLNS